MHIFLTLLFHELRILVIAAPTYIASSIFLFLMGGIYWLALLQAASGPMSYTPAQAWFRLFPLPLFFIVPLLTMRSFAEERRLGTLGALFSTPVRPSQVVLAKFSAVYILYIALWLISMLFPVLAWFFLNDLYDDPRLLSLPTLAGGGLFIAVSSMLYVAIGIFTSSLTRSTLVAALLTFCTLFLLVIMGFLLRQIPFETYSWTEFLKKPADYLDTFRHLDLFLRGIVDTSPLFFFTTGTFLVLGLTVISAESKT
jgi:ABC-2 type transport system permease protein